MAIFIRSLFVFSIFVLSSPLSVQAHGTEEEHTIFVPDVSPATIIVPDEVLEGSSFVVRWSGPKNPTDYLQIRSPDRKRSFRGIAIGKADSEVELIAPEYAGDYAVFYEVSLRHAPLGQAALTVVAAIGSLEVASTVTAGTKMRVNWAGPGQSTDRIYVYKAGSEEALYSISASTKDSKPATMHAPEETGDYQLRLFNNGRELARAAFSVNK